INSSHERLRSSAPTQTHTEHISIRPHFSLRWIFLYKHPFTQGCTSIYLSGHTHTHTHTHTRGDSGTVVEKSFSNQKVASSIPCRSVLEQDTESLIAPDVQCAI